MKNIQNLQIHFFKRRKNEKNPRKSNTFQRHIKWKKDPPSIKEYFLGMMVVAMLSLSLFCNYYVKSNNESFFLSGILTITNIVQGTGSILSNVYANEENPIELSDKIKLSNTIAEDPNNDSDSTVNEEKSKNIKNQLQENSSNKGKFIIIVKVKNLAKEDYKGGIYINKDESDKSKHIYTKFPKSKTITKTFEFRSKDVPTGTGFTVEVVYGADYDKMKHGMNSPSKKPEVFKFTIP